MGSMDFSTEDARMLWDDVVGMARDAGNAELLPWLERLAPVSLEGGVMRVSTTQNWTARKVMGEYRPVIEGLLQEITLEPIELEVAVGGATSQVAAPASTAASSPAASVQQIASAQAATPAQAAPVQTAGIATGQASAAMDQAPTAQQASVRQPSAAAMAGAAFAQTHGGTSPDAAPVAAYVPQTGSGALSPAAQAALEVMRAQASKEAPAGSQGFEGSMGATPAPEPSAPIIDTRSAGSGASLGATVSLERPQAAQAASATQADDAGEASLNSLPILDDGSMPASAVSTGFSDFTFDTYIVGEANKMAYTMARAVAEEPGGLANPLFIWGPSGNGKTHLLLSILNYIHAYQPAMRALYVPANTFVEQYVDDIRVKKLKGLEVLKEYRDIDVLLVDDVQSFEDKQESVSTFFDIFNQLILGGKQIVLAADVAPDYLNLDDRMRTRFNMGSVVSVSAPTYEMKRSILKSFYERCRARMRWCTAQIPDALFDTIAQLAPNNPRNMQGLVTSLLLKAETDPAVLTADGIKGVVNDLFKSEDVVNVPAIIKKVSEYYEVPADSIKGKSRTKGISEARQVVMWMARQLTDESYESIGAYLGGRDHSTVYYGISAIEKRTIEDKAFLHKLERLKNEITKAGGR